MLGLLDRLDDALLFNPEGDAVRPFVSNCRMLVRMGYLPVDRVRPLARLFVRYGIVAPTE